VLEVVEISSLEERNPPRFEAKEWEKVSNRLEEIERIGNDLLAATREEVGKTQERGMRGEVEKRRNVATVSEEDERWRNRSDPQAVLREGLGSEPRLKREERV